MKRLCACWATTLVAVAIIGCKTETANNPKPGDTEFTNSIGMKLVLIPAAEFEMGSPEDEEGRDNDETLHTVKITKPFYIGAFEVTQEQYESVMGNNPSFFRAGGPGEPMVKGVNTANFPVESVTWHDANEFCRKLTAKERGSGRRYRLPTEAEWELACRGGTSTPFYWGSELNGEQANVHGGVPYPQTDTELGKFLSRTTGVGGYPANSFGLYDTVGNVQEWCSDWYDNDYYANSPVDDPQGPESGDNRVTRGGSFGVVPRWCRSKNRDKQSPTVPRSAIGFRVVCELG